MLDLSFGALRTWVPQVRLGDDSSSIAWNVSEPFQKSPPIPEQLIEEFARLADATEQQIVAFAQRWGVLGICDHGRPGMHDGCYPQRDPGNPQNPWAWEPIDAWRRHARQLAGALRIAADLRREKQPLMDASHADGWCAVFQLERGCFDPPPSGLAPEWKAASPRRMWPRRKVDPSYSSVEQQRRLLAQQVTYWFQEAALVPRFSWDGQDPQVILERAGPFAPSSHSIAYRWPRDSLYPVLISLLAEVLISHRLALSYVTGVDRRTSRHAGRDQIVGTIAKSVNQRRAVSGTA